MAVKVKLGFIGSSAPSSPHHESFKAFIPKEIDFTFVQEEGAGGSLYDARGKVDSLIGQATELAEKHGWDGVIISGGPREVLNPGLAARLSVALNSCRHRVEFVHGGFEGILGQTCPADDPRGRQAKRNVSGFSCRVRNRSYLSAANTACSYRRTKAYPG